jgi:hypothetical protein
MQWFECLAKYIKMDENGREKKATEIYLLDAVSFTEAESRIYKELQTMVSGEFTVSVIKKTRISEIIPSIVGDRWYKAKVTFITIDEESGKEKRTSQYVLIFSDDVKNATDNITEAMQGQMADFTVTSVSESKIVDVFPYSGKKEKQEIKETECTIIDTGEHITVIEEKFGVFFCPANACSYNYDELCFDRVIQVN